MLTKKRTWGILILLLVSILGMGCELSDGTENDDAVFSYDVDILYPGIFITSSRTMTMNEWFAAVKMKQSWFQWNSYTAFQSAGHTLFKDAELETAFSGSDTINDDTVIYSDFDFTGYRGKNLGTLTGTITLNDIYDPPPKVWMQSNFWWLNGKVNMSEVTGTSTTLDWSIPVYETGFQPNAQAQLTLSVLPHGSNYTLSVPVSTSVTIDNENANVGSLGTVSIKGVTLSGTINVTYNGEPVPYVEIWANYDVKGIIQDACLFSPGPNAPWTMVLEPSTTERDITFQVHGFTKQNWTTADQLIDRIISIDPVLVSNQDKTGIVLDLGDIENKR